MNQNQKQSQKPLQEWEIFKHLILNSTLSEEEKRYYIHSVAENGCLKNEDRDLLMERLEYNIMSRQTYNELSSNKSLQSIDEVFRKTDAVYDEYQKKAEENDKKISDLADEYDKKIQLFKEECLNLRESGNLDTCKKYLEEGIQKIDEEYAPRFEEFFQMENDIEEGMLKNMNKPA